MLMQLQELELVAAISEQREPQLRYPAIEIYEGRRPIVSLIQLVTEISQEEPNAIIHHLYHATIEEDIDFLRLIEAAYEGNTERFWECNLRLFPVPTAEEMHDALSYVRRALLQGFKHP